MRTMPNGLLIGRKRVPLGVIGAMYESRPNVTIDISALCLKSGNAVILRGGKEAFNSNLALVKLVQQAISRAGVPEGAVQFVENTDRTLVGEMLKLNQYIDLMIPRGGASFVKFVIENAAMPVVAGGIGVCHTFVDSSADMEKAVAIVYNAKVQKPSVCNALDTILVHQVVAEEYLPAVAAELAKAGRRIALRQTRNENIKVGTRFKTESGRSGRLGQGIPRSPPPSKSWTRWMKRWPILRNTVPAIPKPLSLRIIRPGCASSTKWMPPVFTLTPAPASRTAASSGLGRKWASAHKKCMPAARWD